MSLECSRGCCPEAIPSSLQILFSCPLQHLLPCLPWVLLSPWWTHSLWRSVIFVSFPCLHLSSRVISLQCPWAISSPPVWCRTVLVLSLTCHKMYAAYSRVFSLPSCTCVLPSLLLPPSSHIFFSVSMPWLAEKQELAHHLHSGHSRSQEWMCLSHGLKWFLPAPNGLPHQSQLLGDHIFLIFA